MAYYRQHFNVIGIDISAFDGIDISAERREQCINMLSIAQPQAHKFNLGYILGDKRIGIDLEKCKQSRSDRNAKMY